MICICLSAYTLGFCKCEDPGRRQCPDRTCIPEEWFCDGYGDCEQGEDEVNCRESLLLRVHLIYYHNIHSLLI